MPEGVVYIPFERKLYNDLIRFSDGQVDPAYLAEDQVRAWLERMIESGDADLWGERFEDAAAEYAPHVLEALAKDEQQAVAKHRDNRKPLVWKEVTIASGSEVRMSYGGTHRYAQVHHGCIIDDGKEFSPSEWASKVADGTSRNAWRDLWFREPLSKTWIPAQLLRDQAIEEAHNRTRTLSTNPRRNEGGANE